MIGYNVINQNVHKIINVNIHHKLQQFLLRLII